MIRAFAPALICAALLCQGPIPVAAADDEMVKEQVGTWLVAPVSGAKGCRLTFEAGTAIGGHTLTGADGCAGALPALAQASAWNVDDDGSLYIIDATRKVLIRFLQDEGSPWESDDGDPTWLLPALGNVDHVPTIANLAGTWLMKRPDGAAVCKITLSGDKGEDDTAKMSPGGDCPAAVADLKLNLWTTEGFGLVMMGDDGTSLSFDMRADGSFEKSKEEGGEPLTLVRQ